MFNYSKILLEINSLYFNSSSFGIQLRSCYTEIGTINERHTLQEMFPLPYLWGIFSVSINFFFRNMIIFFIVQQ